MSDALRRLEVEGTAHEERRRDPMWLPGVKYTLITAVEGCVDVAQHLCSSEGWGPPADNGDAMRVLAAHGVVPREHAERLARAVGFRNVLVHEYVDVDDSIVLARLGDLSDLDDFLRRVAEWLPDVDR
ncbi:type VII toxin-antitoxin system HepT family RNase toxin [Actinomycetospora atypica]|uniref:DUF86 domain-containing protein n=1 Tax=Actinomycetospora atypica TaxID=1290095 RepID=A0ABV9YI40_9PSEU